MAQNFLHLVFIMIQSVLLLVALCGEHDDRRGGWAQYGCATLVIDPLEIPDELAGVQTKKVGDIAISVAILTDEQAHAHFGANLSDSGVQSSVGQCSQWIAIQPVVYPEYC